MRDNGVRTVIKVALVSLVVACTDGRPEPPPPSEAAAAKPELGPEVGPEVVSEPETELGPEAVAEPEVVDPEQLPSEPGECPQVPETPAAPPEVPAVPSYDGPPQLEVVVADFGETNGVVCPFDVEARGFPIISDDGSTLVDASAFRGSVQVEGEKAMRLTWFEGADDVRVNQVYPTLVGDPPDHGEPLGPYCKPVEARVRERVAQLNAELDARSWRRLEALDALYSNPGIASSMSVNHGLSGEYVDDVIACLAGADRPIEVYYRNGHLIARIRGIRVLQDLERPEWRQRASEFCTSDAQVEALEFDRATKQALVRFNYFDGGCLCENGVQVRRIELSPELFAEIDQRSMAKFMALHRAFE